MSVFHDFIRSIGGRSSRVQNSPVHDARPSERDLALQTLKKKYREFLDCEDRGDKEPKLFQIVPLFNKTCGKIEGAELVEKFGEVFDFAENVAFIFVRHVTQLAQSNSETLLDYFEADGDSPGAGRILLKAIAILARGPDTIVNAMMSSNLSSILVRCLHLFLDLPSPYNLESDIVKSKNPMESRTELHRLFIRVLNRLLRHGQAVSDLLKFEDLSLLFGAISSPCSVHNKIWRKAAAETLMTVCKHNLTDDVIDFIHQKKCVGFCIRNINSLMKTFPPLELTEILVALTCCLKDASEYSQSLIDDFAAGGGYTLLYEFMMKLDSVGEQDARDAQRHVILLTSDLVSCGYDRLAVTTNEPGPFNPGFKIPEPLGGANTVKNKDAFMVLHNAFLRGQTSHIGNGIIDAIINIYKCDSANFFILEPVHSLSTFLEALVDKNQDVQANVFRLLEFVVVELGYIPTDALTSVGLLLDRREYPRTQCLALNYILKFISHKASFKDVYREAGILALLINALKATCDEVKDNSSKSESSGGSTGGISSILSPSLPLATPEGNDEECMFLIVECVRATVEGSSINGRAFTEAGGVVCIMDMIHMSTYRRMALRLMTQLILLEDGYVHMGRLLDLLNTASPSDVALRIDILQTIIGVFQLENSRKALFRDGCGFHYLISVLTSLYGSLGPLRCEPWSDIPRADILQLIQLVFTVLTMAMQDDPANRLFFETNIRFDSFSAPLRLLGCFAKDLHHFPSQFTELDSLNQSNVDSEFAPLSPPPVELPRDSFIYCASEIFRYLRDMALGIPLSQSKPLLRPPKSARLGSPTVTQSATPILPHTSKIHIDGQPKKFFSGYLIHPGAILCMMDLLPGVDYDAVLSQGPPECYVSEVSIGELPRDKDIPDVAASMVEECDGGDMDIACGRKWCLYLQDCVVREIYNIAGSERNQQSLCQVGLPGRLLTRCRNPLSDESHPLHEGLERTFEKLSYQSLTPSDFRNFLRLGNPLSCSINDVSIEKLKEIAEKMDGAETPESNSKCSTSGPVEPHNTVNTVPKARPLSLARIQSLVSMTTPRDGILYGSSSLGSSPPFVEFDMGLDGFGCLFLPSVFPQSVAHNSQTNTMATTGYGSGGERAFPPSGGLTYSTWISIGNIQSDETHKINLLTLSQCFLTMEKTLASYPLLRIYITPQEQFLFVSTQIPLEKRDSVIEDYIHKDDRKEKNLEVGFPCTRLCYPSHGMWHHVVVMIQTRGLRGRAKASLFLDGKPTGAPQKLPYIHPLPMAVSSQFIPYPSDSSPYLINAHIGTHVDNRHITPMVYRLGPTYLFDEPLGNMPIHHIYQLGPLYLGSFQNPTQDNMSANLLTESLGQQVPEERIVFGLIADCSSNHTLLELVNNYQYSTYDSGTIARELLLADNDDVTPVTLISNSALHLSGPARTIGGVVCGFTGIRTFEPQPLRNLLSAVGGTSVVLGLVAMANDVDSLYAAMKAMVCIVGNNPRALKEMERTGGFQLLGMLIRSKSHLVNSNILHLMFTLVGTVDSEHESACLRSIIAFKDVLADQSIWKDTTDEIQKSLCQHFYDLLTHSNDQLSNAHAMLTCKLIPELLMRLHNSEMADPTAKAMINVINALLSHGPSDEDVRRYGQLLASLLPRDHSDENPVSLYDHSPPRVRRGGEDIAEEGWEDKECGNDRVPPPPVSAKESEIHSKTRRRIRLRNHLFDVLMSHLTTERNEFDIKFANQLCSTLGFDWLIMFVQPQVHIDTVVRALRMLVLLMSDKSIKQRFLQGEVFGGWLHGIRSVLPEYAKEMKKTLLFSSSSNDQPELPLPGHMMLAHLLPSHLSSSQPILLMIAMLLGVHVTEIPFRASLDLECLDAVFGIGRNTKAAARAGSMLMVEAVHPILSVVRTLLHLDSSEADHQALVIVKFLELLYHHIPNFKQAVSSGQELIESLAATLFPPPTIVSVEDDEENEFIILNESVNLASEDNKTIKRTPSAEYRPALLRSDCSAVMNIVKLLRIISLDGFVSCQQSQKPGYSYECPVLEMVLEAAPLGNSELVKTYQTVVLVALMKHIEGGNEDVVVTLKDVHPFSKSVVGFTVFCQRLVDKLWQGFYVKPSDYMYNFLKNLVDQALTKPKILPLQDLFSALNRMILYQLSVIPESEPEQKELVDTLCLLSSHSHIIFDEMNTDFRFLECLLYQLLSLVFTESTNEMSVSITSGSEPPSPDSLVSSGSAGSADMSKPGKLFKRYVPIMASSLLKSGANRLWSKMLEHKRDSLEQILGKPLPIPPSRGNVVGSSLTGPTGSVPPVTLPLSLGNAAHTKLQNCKEFLSDGSLKKCWHEYHASEVSPTLFTVYGKDKGLIRTLLSKRKTTRISGRDPSLVVEEYIRWQCPQLIICAHKLEDAIMRKYRRHLEYKLRFTASEWARIEHELTRERGLWGSDEPSMLDKWMLDFVEGPNRMRKRMCRNYLFYDHYTDIPERLSNKSHKHQNPTSYHIPLFRARNSLLPCSSLLELPFPFPPSHVAMSTPRAREDSIISSSKQYEKAALEEGSNRTDLLSSLDNDDPVARALFKMIDEKITEFYQCARLTGLDSIDGLLLFGNTSFYVVEGITYTRDGSVVDIESATEGSYDPVIPYNLHCNLLVTGENKNIQCTKWSYMQIREVHKRRYLLRHCALEVFSNDGLSLFLIFNLQQRDKIYQKLFSLARPSDQEHLLMADPEMNPESVSSFFSSITGKRSLTQKWENGEISNFSYLVHLNTLAGRSYNDLMQYPVFPWIIADYESQTLDLTVPKTFRDLSLPMGAQSSKRLEQFIERYKHFEDPLDEVSERYYYGTHYSSAMSVASFLIRMEPFTRYFIKLQGGHFDLADRMFHSIPEAWKSASESNMADIKELIPEFFYLPEFLSNSNCFDLGIKQNTEELNNVILPPWSKGCPMEFIRVHREALESDYVSAHLHEWIDLIFGYKQRGKEAEKNHNVFHPLFYEGTVDIDTIEDSMRRSAVISFIHNFGQMPKQLFKKPHRQRRVFTGTTISSPLTDPTLLGSLVPQVFFKNLAQLLPSKDPVKVIHGEVGQIAVSASDRQLIAVEKRKILLPPLYNKVFSWGYMDQSARISMLEGDKVISVFEGMQQGRILCAAALDESVFLTAGESTVVYVWNLKATRPKEKSPIQINLKHTLHGHTAPVTCLATSSTYNIIVSGSKDTTCILWDSNKLLFVHQLTGHQTPVTIVTINQLNGNIVSCTRNEIRLWTVNGILLARAELTITGNFRMTCCTVSEMFEWDNDNVIITGSSDGIVRFWHLQYERDDDQIHSQSPLGIILPALSVSEDSDANQYHVYPGRPLALTKPIHQPDTRRGVGDDLEEESSAGLESSDTESSKGLGREEDERELENEEPENESLPKTPDAVNGQNSTFDSIMEQLIKEAKQKAAELSEKTGKWRRRLVLAHTLTMHTSFQRQDNVAPAVITCIYITRDHRKLFVGDSRGRVFSWSVADNPGGVMEHWILDEAVSNCMRCNTEFTLTDRKHHCRDCGKIFCARCSDYQSEVDRLRINKKVRVCRDCYERN